ncbi:Serine/threonine protein kinase [Pseudoloma neurophilia]|uniref:non-specific serine/threonine protein kinase n=1 Tax=Pseudoloma neurophilia TaxID=146866 RepID=A0A0R0M3U5_9MICR|nr:Serine/threonine protein kinase [Pseudoloma neurophilia]
MKYFKELDDIHVQILKKIEKNGKKINDSVHLRDLIKEKMVVFDKKYILTYKGYDHLALQFFKRKGLGKIINQIDIGKESDIFLAEMNGQLVAVKMYRIGRTSYRKTENRDNFKLDMYKKSFLYCKREYQIMKELKNDNIAEVVGYNRNVLITKYYDCRPMVKTRLDDLDYFYNKLFDLLVSLYALGYVHGDFNEYNILVKEKELILIDFPQAVKINTKNATEILEKDVQCIKEYFLRKYRYTNERNLLEEIQQQ